MPDSKPLWSVAAFAAATGGRLLGEAPSIGGISIDTRTLNPGDAFFAIKGDQFDGHDFAAAALAAGAALAVVSEAKLASIDARPVLVVPDVLEGMRKLGIAARARSTAKVLAITGSVGKTGTKEALRAALSASGETFASAASYNNHWGVPLSLARLPQSAEFAVFEIGMNHPGEITPLTKMVRPHFALITTIAPVHLGFFDSVDQIAAAKAEIFDGLEPDATAILNRDNSFFDYLSEKAMQAGAGRIVSFGEATGSDARLEKMALKPDCSAVAADILGDKVTYKIGAPGAHLVMNSLAVLAAVKLMGGDLARGALALGQWRAPKGRGKQLNLQSARGSITIIDESYNANPASMRAAIATLGASAQDGSGRRIAVLGDMLELGETAPALHAELANPLAEAGVDLIYTAGPLMESLYAALGEDERGGHAASSDGLMDLLADEIRPGDVVMIKGSLGSRMGPVVDALRRHLEARYEARLAEEAGD